MKLTILSIITIIIACGTLCVAQEAAVPITGGRFFMERGVQNLSNATIETANFKAVSWVGASDQSVWNICSSSSNPQFCRVGTSFNVPAFPIVEVGYCGACNPPQFPRGSFIINGRTYQDVYFSGQFQFSTSTFLASQMLLAKRKGLVRFRSPFTMTGSMKVCRTVNDLGCRDEDTIYDGQITGHGTLTVTTKIELGDWEVPYFLFLTRESIDYQFEP